MKKHDFTERGKRMDDDRRRVRDALERSTDGATPDLEPLLDAVPRMLAEAARRREQAQRVDLLTASIPFARTAIPRLAAAAAVLVAITTVLLLRGADVSTTTVTTTVSPASPASAVTC